jgi:hypothetical protein
MTDILEEYEHKLAQLSTTREEALGLYAEALAEYEKRKRAAVETIRERLRDPHWQPKTWISIGLKPPTNPTAVRF